MCIRVQRHFLQGAPDGAFRFEGGCGPIPANVGRWVAMRQRAKGVGGVEAWLSDVWGVAQSPYAYFPRVEAKVGCLPTSVRTASLARCAQVSGRRVQGEGESGPGADGTLLSPSILHTLQSSAIA